METRLGMVKCRWATNRERKRQRKKRTTQLGVNKTWEMLACYHKQKSVSAFSVWRIKRKAFDIIRKHQKPCKKIVSFSSFLRFSYSQPARSKIVFHLVVESFFYEQYFSLMFIIKAMIYVDIKKAGRSIGESEIVKKERNKTIQFAHSSSSASQYYVYHFLVLVYYLDECTLFVCKMWWEYTLPRDQYLCMCVCDNATKITKYNNPTRKFWKRVESWTSMKNHSVCVEMEQIFKLVEKLYKWKPNHRMGMGRGKSEQTFQLPWSIIHTLRILNIEHQHLWNENKIFFSLDCDEITHS